MTAPRAARREEPNLKQDQLKPAVSLGDYRSAPIKFKKQITDLERFFADKWSGRHPDTEASHRDAAIMFDLLAVYQDGLTKMQVYLERQTCFDRLTGERLKRAALARAVGGYSPAQLGELVGLRWSVRKRLKITNIDAIDTPAPEILVALRKSEDREYKRRLRAEKSSLPKPTSAAKRRSANLQERRSAAIQAVIELGKSLTVKDVSQLISRLKHTPFYGAKAASLPRLIRRTIEADTVEFMAELRQISGRPDLNSPLWIMRRPHNEDEYRTYFVGRLSEFTAADAAELAPWFYSQREKALRESCGIAPDDDGYMKLARQRRNALTSLPDKGTES